jgi:signal transduction histidine kinase
MTTSNKPEQIQVFYEIAMSIGSSLNLEEMLKISLMAYLRKLNFSSGTILQLYQNKNTYYYKSVMAIPYITKNNKEFEDVFKLIPNKTSISSVEEFLLTLPLQKQFNTDSIFYVMDLPDFGLICLKKSGNKLEEDVLYTLKNLNKKLAQAAIGCLKNMDLINAKENAVESDRLKTAFIENISHEIRTPLNAIMGYSALIADGHISEKMLSIACKSIVNSSDSLLAMIEALLEISMLESGNLKPKFNLCNINQLLLDQEHVFYHHVQKEQKEQLNLRILTPLNDLFIVSDIVRLQQIIENLLSNAIRFSEKGEIEIGYKKQDASANNNTPVNLVFYIKDEGIGIPENKIKEVFKPFHRIFDSSEKIYSGTGIGLTIAHHLTHILEGKIWIESALEKGTTVYFSIPAIRTVDDLITDL